MSVHDYLGRARNILTVTGDEGHRVFALEESKRRAQSHGVLLTRGPLCPANALVGVVDAYRL